MSGMGGQPSRSSKERLFELTRRLFDGTGNSRAPLSCLSRFSMGAGGSIGILRRLRR
jgi:hypothetical protein